MLKLEAARAKVLEIARKAAQTRLVPLTMGNFSVRDAETGLMAITPTGRPYENMSPADICLVAPDGTQVDGPHKFSFETPIHLYVYRMRPQVNGIVHIHSPYANAFSLVGKPIPIALVTQLVYVRQVVPIAPYSQSGNEDFAKKAMDAMGDGNVVVLANHGILAVGRDIDEAFALGVYTEEGAEVYFHALQLGADPFTLEGYLKKDKSAGG